MSFSALLDSAMAGSQRHSPKAALAEFEHLPPESRLLRGASYEGLRRLAGRPLDPTEGLVRLEPCRPETRAAIPPAATERLLKILAARPELLLEWLGLVAARNLRVSPDCVADLLEHARARPETHDLVVQVGGERLAWLAGFNTDWRFARRTRTHPDEQLASGSPPERVRALRDIRSQDPARGRALLQAILRWRSERAETRSALLETLAEGLSAEDEPMLEEAVRDRRREVREQGLRLIRRIPNARFGQRWSTRVRELMALSHGPRGPRISIREPAEPDPSWIEDGLDPRPPKGIGTTAWILQQTMAFAPPSIWPRGILGAFQRSEWSQPLLNGLAQAAAAYADASWSEELLVAWADTTKSREHAPSNARALFSVLTPARAEAVSGRLLDVGAPWAATLAASSTFPWSDAFSRLIIGRLPELIGKFQYAAGSFLQTAPLRLDPAVLPEAERLRDVEINPAWTRPAVLRLVRTLEFRLAMREELEAA